VHTEENFKERSNRVFLKLKKEVSKSKIFTICFRILRRISIGIFSDIKSKFPRRKVKYSQPVFEQKCPVKKRTDIFLKLKKIKPRFFFRKNLRSSGPER